jgi:hypothetical protein
LQKQFETIRSMKDADKPTACDMRRQHVKRKLAVIYAPGGGMRWQERHRCNCGSCSGGNCAGCG